MGLFRPGYFACSACLVAACGGGGENASNATGGGAGSGSAGKPAASGGSSGAASAATGGASAGSLSGAGRPGSGGTNAGGNGVGGRGASAGGSMSAGGTGSGALAGGGGTAGTALGGAAGSGGTAPLGTLAVTGLKIDPNPNMTISCFVSWTTAEAASSEVDFGETEYEFRIRDAALVTEHRVLVIGMHADKTYKLKAVSTSATASGSAEGTFTTGKLPAGIPTATLTVGDPTNTETGWLLTNIQGSFSAPAQAVMYDQTGVPVWYFTHGTHGDSRGDVQTELVTNTVIVGPTSGEPGREVDLSGKILWEGPANGSQQQIMTHYLGKTSMGTYLLNYEVDKAGTSGNTKIDDQRLEEVSATNAVVWSWKLFDHVEPSGTREELCHGNMLVLDEPRNILYYNCRFVGLFKLDRATGDIAWRLGGTYDKTSLGAGDFTFDPPESQFSDAHEPELFDDGTLILYDNGGYQQGSTGGGNYHSRVLEYQIDQTKMTATRTFEFPGSFTVDAWYKNDWYSPYWGDVDRLPSGNFLVTAALHNASGSTRFFEVTREGKVVWELTNAVNYGSFKAQRLAPPPLVERL